MSFETLSFGLFDEQHVKVTFKPQSHTRTKAAQDHIREKWEVAKKEKPSIFAGMLVNIVKNNSDSKNIRLDAIKSTYDDYYTTKTKEFQKKFPNEIQPNPLSVGCILVTNDGCLVFGIRDNHLVMAPGKTTVISGMADDRDIVELKEVDLFGCIRREIKEESGIKPHEIHGLTCIGLVNNQDEKQTYVPFFGKTKLSFDDIIQREKDNEFKKLVKIKNLESKIMNMLKNNDLSDIVIPSLQIYLKLFSTLNSK